VNDQLDSLRAALEGRYAVDRLIGQGGMATADPFGAVSYQAVALPRSGYDTPARSQHVTPFRDRDST
jgi:hypothetical protein